MAGIPGLDVTELNPETINVGPDGRAIPRMGPVSNPNVGAGGSAEAQAFRQGLRTPGIVPEAAAGGSRVSRALSSVRGLATRAAPRLLGRAGLVGLAGEGGAAVGSAISDNLSDETNDTIGGTINEGLRRFGLGVDTTAMDTLRAGLPPPAPVARQPGVDTGGQGGDFDAPVNPALIQRDGNSFSNVAAPAGGLRYTDGSASKNPIGVVPGGPTATPQEVQAASLALAPYTAGAHNADGSGGIAGINTTTQGNFRGASNQVAYDKAREQYQIQQALNSPDRAVRAAAVSALGQDNQNSSAERVATLREQGETTRANAANRTQMAIHHDNNQVSLRGQDVTARGQDISARTAAVQARIEQQNKDRQYGLEVQKFGKDVADTNLRQREAADKNLNDWLGNSFVTKDEKGNAVPDKATAAAFTQAATQTVGNLAARLEASGDPANVAKAKELREKGIAGLDAEDRATLKVLFDRKQRFEQTRGLGPFSGGGPVSNDLNDFAIVGNKNGMIQKRYQMAGGQTIGQNDLRYTEPANAVLPDVLKTPTADLGPTPAERARGLR